MCTSPSLLIEIHRGEDWIGDFRHVAAVRLAVAAHLQVDSSEATEATSADDQRDNPTVSRYPGSSEKQAAHHLPSCWLPLSRPAY